MLPAASDYWFFPSPLNSLFYGHRMSAKRNASPKESSSTANVGFGRFRKDADVRWQPSEARSTAIGSPEGERGGDHQFGVPPKRNCNSAWVRHSNLHQSRPLASLRDRLPCQSC